jgi:hypothetical protein
VAFDRVRAANVRLVWIGAGAAPIAAPMAMLALVTIATGSSEGALVERQ